MKINMILTLNLGVYVLLLLEELGRSFKSSPLPHILLSQFRSYLNYLALFMYIHQIFIFELPYCYSLTMPNIYLQSSQLSYSSFIC